MDLSKYKVVSYEASSKGFGLAILVKMPDGEEVDEALKSTIKDAQYKLYDEIVLSSHKNNPDTIQQDKKIAEKLKSLFQEPIFVEKVPNEYSKFGSPWLVVTTKIGRFKVGYRSKVIHIDWSDTKAETGTGYELFRDEGVTCGGQYEYDADKWYVHAWSLEKGREYIQKIIDLGVENG